MEVIHMSKSKNKGKFVTLLLIIFLNAGLLDLKYKGFLYRLLPSALQSYVDTLLGRQSANLAEARIAMNMEK